ncbi:MAG TPA: MazG nucleotide pyrophosphohydrolase domain-containing protein [Planctomycetota bacterium]|nr:MazG nucleotide pyrophosphohydrolase domain-containing protein [Planctomycetota bacterium]
MTIEEFQKAIEEIYFGRDSARGLAGTFMWFAEEVGELAAAIRRGESDNLHEEFADVFAWLVSLASVSGIRMEDAVRKYADGCPYCKNAPCTCSDKV